MVCIVSGSNNDITRMEENQRTGFTFTMVLKHYFMVKFPQRPGSLKDFVLMFLGENDDINTTSNIPKKIHGNRFGNRRN